MPLDCYKVEVLYLHNPHLIWVEVRDAAITCIDERGIKFEQIGIYGVLPLETTIDLDDEEITVQSCKEWVPASATMMRKFFADEEDVMFSPLHLDRRSSIFDDNIHKFGDLFVKKKNGKTKYLSQLLSTSGFATNDPCLFQQYLREGKINTKLNSLETQNVLTEIEKYFINKNLPKKKLEKHTSVARAACELEEALTKTNLDKHNKNMKAILESKNRDLELCKGVDEVSVGRATSRKGKEKKILTPIEKKLELLQIYKTKADSKASCSLEASFDDTKMYLESIAFPYSKKISSKTDAHKAHILKKVMSKTAIKKGSIQEKVANRLLAESEENNKTPDVEVEINKTVNQTNSFSSSTYNSISGSEPDEISKTEETNQSVEIDETTSSSTIQDQQVLDNNNDNITNISLVPETQGSSKESNSICQFDQEQPVKAQSTETASLQEDNMKNRFNDSCNVIHFRRSSKGKATKKVAKAEVNIASLEPQDTFPQTHSRAHSSVPQKLAYPPQNVNRYQETLEFSRRVPEISNDCKAFASTPVSENTVKKLMTTFKLTGSRHSDMIQNAIRKCKDGAKNNNEAITALLECRSKIIDEIQELDNSRTVGNIDVDQTFSRTVVKTKVKRRGKKHNVVSTKTKTIFGPPGVDLNALSRVPPVFLYGDEISRKDGQNSLVIPNRIDSLREDMSVVTSGGDKSDGPSTSCEVKLATESVTTQDSDIIKQINENEDTSSPNSSVWERRLKLHKEIVKNKRCATQTPDTTQKDSSNIEKNTPPKELIQQDSEDDSDESISAVISKLSVGNSMIIKPTPKVDHSSVGTLQHVGCKSNPFLNFDINNSIFVDNLVTPLLMVHSKMNKRFVPNSTLRDINFSEHIRLVLKNVGIDSIMCIQSVSWNAVLRGHSVFLIGATFCGKSVGYIPAVCQLVTDFTQSESYSDSVGPCCIIVCATSQSVSEIENFAKMLVGCNEKIVSCYYGYDELAIATSLLNGCDLLICTAPSLVRLLQIPQFGLDLQRLATFVLEDCERLSKVYSTELKFCLHKIKEMQKSRINKELSVQYIIASRTWCDFMEPFAKKVPDLVVCISAYHECVLYAKANMTVRYVKKDNKLQYLFDFLQDIDPSKKTIIVCNTSEEVLYLKKAIAIPKYFVFACTSKLSVNDLSRLVKHWSNFKEPVMAPVLICVDATLYHMNVDNAHYLVHYSLPPLFSIFSRRFGTLNGSYSSLFRTDKEITKILILLEEKNVNEFPKIIHFVRRCTNNIPNFVDDICMAILADKDSQKAKTLMPLCDSLLSLGECPELYNCQYRHTFIKDYDQPEEWIPKSGIVTFKILHLRSVSLYSAILLDRYLDGGETIKYSNAYSIISLKVGIHYSNTKNRILLGVPKLGDVCAVSIRNNLFQRCQVLKIMNAHERARHRNVLVNLIDEELPELTSETNLYHLPDALKPAYLKPCVVNVRLANIQPRDKDLVFSKLATDYLNKELSDDEKGIYMKGNIILTLGNCVYVDTLEICKDLKSLNETVVIHDVIRGLLEKYAEVNPDHITKIKELCKKAKLEIKSKENNEQQKNELLPAMTATSKVRWAHLDEDMSIVDFGVVENPDILFVRLAKFDECMKVLIRNIQTYVTGNTAKIEELIKDDIVLAEYPDDGLYERARIDEIGDEKVKCFFVDQGEWRHLNKDKIMPISDALITQLPFQTIECRLVGVKPLGDQWTDFACNWLFDKCAESVNSTTKQLFVQYFTKEPARFTGGHKYGVVVIDTYGNVDLILNQAMIDLNLAKENEDEMKFVENVKRKNEQELKCGFVDNDNSFEELSKYSPNSVSPQNVVHTTLLPRPIRSIPLVGTDDESDDTEKWNINMTADMAEMFRQMVNDRTEETDSNVLAIESNKPALVEEMDTCSPSTNLDECPCQIQSIETNPDLPKELDSDDLSSPESCQSATNTQKVTEVPLHETQLRKPKISWRQTKATVILKIQLIGVDEYDLSIQDRTLIFTTTVNDTDYGCDIELYGVIDKKSAFHTNKGQYILVKLNKIKRSNWLALTKDVGIRKWIVYDVDSIDVSSEEEEVQQDDFYNIMKNMHHKVDSESDDDFIDDVGYGQKNYD